ncbi:S1 family peptidase [Demequina zhanjiangensis]|uniref:Trypsin-like serine protease n=1 Tax=Demequina zhanjiangensis TaxID=3051659 RepID=A0ABT8FYE3_9MICO|nr:trypsin-like serine protease [Demequina sp. SYSU T00b26]MDN4471916.1 trypsin-like serine protease [Demequina sp. SYSU T00b26]
MRSTLKALVSASAAVMLTAALAVPAAAIKNGEPDDGAHPYVGLMVADDANGPAWRCSGTLVSPTVYVTAGHCTYGAESVTIWFHEDVNDRATYGYPFGDEVLEPGTDLSVEGSPYTHPEYDDAAFYLHDLGVVVLDEPVYLDEYGTLPEQGLFDALLAPGGKKTTTFTPVGYGLQRSLPAQTGLTEASLTRLTASVKIINADAAFGEKKAGNAVLFTNNASGGGTCSGDSGGPIFVAGTTTIAAVTSYGLNATCSGTGGGYRIDQPDDLAFLAQFVS